MKQLFIKKMVDQIELQGSITSAPQRFFSSCLWHRVSPA
jgi:hypothetical protein